MQRVPLRHAATAGVATVVLAVAGCDRTHTKVNSDPGPDKASRAEKADQAVTRDATSDSDPTASSVRPRDSAGPAAEGKMDSRPSGTAAEKPKNSSDR